MDNIITRIQVIFKEKFSLEVSGESFVNDTSLGANGIGFDAIYMYYFIDFVEKEFNISFKREHFVSGAVRTLSGVCRVIKELQEKMDATETMADSSIYNLRQS